MAIFDLTLSVVQRSKGQSAPKSVAYATGQALQDPNTGVVSDYRRKASGVAHVETVGWPGATKGSSQAEQREAAASLSYAAAKREKRRDACEGRTLTLALPAELDDAQRLALARGFCLKMRDRYGVACVLSVHRPPDQGDARNHHAHVFMTRRKVNERGELLETVKELDAIKTGSDELLFMRGEWEKRVNSALERAGSTSRISGAKRQDLAPMEHLGPGLTAMERRGKPSRKGQRNSQRLEMRGKAVGLMTELSALQRDESDEREARAREQKREAIRAAARAKVQAEIAERAASSSRKYAGQAMRAVARTDQKPQPNRSPAGRRFNEER